MKIIVMITLSLLTSVAWSQSRFIVSSKDLPSIKKELKKEPVAKVKNQQESFTLTPAEVAKLKSKFPQAKIEPDVIFSVPPVKALGKPQGGTATQPPQSVPWGINAVRASSAYNRGAGVRVCVIDTGIDKAHPDLPGSRIEAYGVPGNQNKSADDNGHGTHVSGTIAAQNNSIGVVGIAPDVTIVSVKALNRQGSGYSSDLANAIDICIAKNTKVINASWGSAGYSSVIADAVTRATSRGIYFVAAAGNESTSVSYPAALSNSIAISAVDAAMNFASFSNYGAEVDFAAPGVNALSTLPGGKYQAWNGTSMATPHAVGVIAIMIAAGKSILGVTPLSLPVYQQGQGLVDAETSSY